MENSKVKELIEEVKVKDPTIYEYADAYLTCHKCGSEFKLFENVKGGMRVDLYTTDQHKLILHCTNCDNKMEIGFKDATNPPVEEDNTTDDAKQDTNVPKEPVQSGDKEPALQTKIEEPQTEGVTEDSTDEAPKESPNVQDPAEVDGYKVEFEKEQVISENVHTETAEAVEGLKQVGQTDLATEVEKTLNAIDEKLG